MILQINTTSLDMSLYFTRVYTSCNFW